jgi:hypothetical protein
LQRIIIIIIAVRRFSCNTQKQQQQLAAEN